MIGSLVFSGCVKVFKILQFNGKTDLWPSKLLLENAHFSLSKLKNNFLWGMLYKHTTSKKSLGTKMVS